MYNRSDWELSLKFAKKFWIQNRERICSEWWLGIKKNRADRLKEWMSSWMVLDEKTMILQIGPGAEGIINFLGIGKRFAIDPLADFYRAEFNQILDSSVTFTCGVGEKLPYEDEMFDLVIIYNVLDHTFSPQKVLSEIYRVLKVGKINHLAVHIYHKIWLPYLKLNRYIREEKEHVWKYTSGIIKRDLRLALFQIIDIKCGGDDESSIPNWMPLNSKLRIKRLVGLSAPMLHILSKKGEK